MNDKDRKRRIEERALNFLNTQEDGKKTKVVFTKKNHIKWTILRGTCMIFGVCCLGLIRYNLYLGLIPALIFGFLATWLGLGTDAYRYAMKWSKEVEKIEENGPDHDGR